jgi:hypothetical protein
MGDGLKRDGSKRIPCLVPPAVTVNCMRSGTLSQIFFSKLGFFPKLGNFNSIQQTFYLIF